MAMEKQYVIRETHTRAISALGYNPIRREILIGCEDGVIKTLEAEGGKVLQTAHEHRGWITDFLYWMDTRLMLSAANDGYIIAWASGGGVYDKIQLTPFGVVSGHVHIIVGGKPPGKLRFKAGHVRVIAGGNPGRPGKPALFGQSRTTIGTPVYCMALNPRRHQLVCGINGGVQVYNLDENKECGHVINRRVVFHAKEHMDIVRCVVCHESRIYSAGYDQKLVIYDSSYTSDGSLEPLFVNPKAHDAGISCLNLIRDNENNTWILTGSFDKSVKIWSGDGKIVHKLDNFISTVSGICYVPRNKTIWAAGGTAYASLFDPKSGDNVSDFIGTFQNQEEEKYHLQILKFFPELNQVVASTSRRHLIVWKYNPSGCITALKCKTPLQSLCYTHKVPLLIFSGDGDGVISKWERMQSNHFMYSKEMFLLSDSKMRKKRRAGSKARELMLEKQLEQNQMTTGRGYSSSRNNKPITSSYAFNKPAIPPVSTHKHPHTTILTILFIESLDFIVAASEDSNIYVWGFDDAAVNVLRNMKPEDLEILIKKYSILLDPTSELHPKNAAPNSGSDSVTNRVAGFILKYVLSEHMSCVTSLVVIGREHGHNGTYVLSGGWDRRIYLWDLESGEYVSLRANVMLGGQLHDTLRGRSKDSACERVVLACDGIILDMDFSPKNNEFAYASSDKMVYIRNFSTNGSRMTLVNTLQGHEGEITCVKWNPTCDKWVTGSEDGTIRIWSGVGMNECEQVLSTQGSVSCMCIDSINGSIVAGVQHIIRVYDLEEYRLVQSNVGHTDAVRSIIHIPERNQYVSCCWDKTIRVWNAWKMPSRKRAPTVTIEEKSRRDVRFMEVVEHREEHHIKDDIGDMILEDIEKEELSSQNSMTSMLGAKTVAVS